jgi:hypothetical protein
MKKHVFFIAGIFISSMTFAQNKVALGIKAGVVNSTMSGDAISNLNNLLDFADGHITTSSRTGFFAGVNGQIPLGATVILEPGLYYSQKGYVMNGDLNLKGMEFLGANAKATLQSQYLDIPVLLKANLGSGLQIFAGPQFSYLAQADLKTTAGVFGVNLLDRTMDATDQFNRWDAAVTGGLGYTFKNGINLSAAYDYGLTKMDKNKNVNAYSRGIKVGLGINF